MNDRKMGKFQVFVIVLLVLLLAAAFGSLFLGEYGVALVLIGVWMAFVSSIWMGTTNEVY
ncbi:hypothetical protein [Ureibacillus acetophenoni]|uniref:Uncharacterized protein n=1 Tax=Ureibacillus acetophenoni TaxID=614649 RepID=A0A285UPC1_9BACL|nr:hypothetical protein [Ureibacillus acetophenoni]SOC43734.1 hypothetical protein SAMN05877842_11729 [Ureibacillus acetophenoni]